MSGRRVARSSLGEWGRRVSDFVKPTLYAGGIVVRRVDGQPRVLIVSTRRRHDRWVLPKGRVEKGESSAEAALREVREEAGVTGHLVGHAGKSEYWTAKGRVRIDYYLIEYRRATKDDAEDRAISWCAVEDAIQRLTYASARRVLLDANRAIVAYLRSKAAN